MTIRRKLAMGTAAIALALTAHSAPAQAQDTGTAAMMDEITVTARRRAERLLDVPLSVTAFDAAAIEDAGFQNFNDIFLLSPGVFNSTSGGRSDRVTIRGQSQVSTTGGSNAGIFLDGIFTNSPVSALGLEAIERVEIIKGPQSTQFGRGTLAGAVNYVTKRPSFETEGQIKVSVATLGEYEASALVSAPITEKLAFLLSGRVRDKESEFYNAFEMREDMGGESEQALNAGLLWEPTEGLSIYGRVNYLDIDNDPIGIYTQGPEFNNCNLDTVRDYFCGEVEIDYDNIRNITRDPNYVDGEAGTQREILRAALLVDWEIGNHLFQSITGWAEEDERWGSDATNRAVVSSALLRDGSAVDISRDWEDWSQEVRYSTDFLDESVRLLVGGFYFESERNEIATYNGDDRGTFSESGYALLGSLEWAITDQLTLTGEVRYQEEDIELDDPDSNLFVEASFDATLPRITLDWQATDDMMVYGVYSEGNKPGSVNTRLLADLDPALIPIDEENNTNYEIGIKGRAFDDRITYQAAAYWIQWEDQQLTQQCEPPQCAGAVTYTDNIGETEITGFELDIAAQLIPGTWDVRFTLANADAEIDFLEVIGSSTVEQEAEGFGFPVDPNDGDGVIVSGTPVPASPEWSFSFTNNVTGDLGMGDFTWYWRSDYAYLSEQFASIFGEASSGTRHDLQMRVGIENETWRLEAFGTNLTDDEAPRALVRTIAFEGSPGPPTFAAIKRSFAAIIPEGRQLGIRAFYNF